MREITSIIFLLIFVSLASCGGDVNDIYDHNAPPVIRTDFTDEPSWNKIRREVATTNALGFSANVRFMDDIQYNEMGGQELLKGIPELSDYGCVFVADATAMASSEHHLLVLDPFNATGKTFRVIPSEVWGVENNLSIANMDYSEFVNSTDPDGVFRGFK